jgi:polyisoprenoid-binding protein YceI
VRNAMDQTKRAEVPTLRYLTANDRSKFTVRAFATGPLSALGHSPTIAIPDFKGEALVDPNAIEESSLRVLIQAASLVVTDDLSDKDREEINRRMHEEVLECDSYPEILYECTVASASKTGEGQYWVALHGQLSLHGVRRSHPVSARVTLAGDTLRAAGEFSVRQSDYEIKPVSAVGGAVKLKDDLKLSFDITARKQS